MRSARDDDRGHRFDRETAGVGTKHRVLWRSLVGVAPELQLESEPLRDSFDHDVAAQRLVEFAAERDPAEGGVGFVLRELAPLDAALQPEPAGGDDGPCPFARLRVNVEGHHRVAGRCQHLRDTRAHYAAAYDSDSFHGASLSSRIPNPPPESSTKSSATSAGRCRSR